MASYKKEPVDWITVNGKHIPIYDKNEDSKHLTEIEEDAINYWKGGNNGRAYADIRAEANGIDTNNADAKRLLPTFESAVSKAPDVEGETVVRVAGDWRIPGLGEPQIGQEFTLPKYESFSKASEKNYDALMDSLGQGMSNEILFRIKADDTFKDISNLGHATGGTAIEAEVVTSDKSKYEVIGITPVNTEGTWLNPEGTQKYIIVDIKRR